MNATIFGRGFEREIRVLIFSTACQITESFQWEPSCSVRTDRHDEANSRFSLFCERAEKEHDIFLYSAEDKKTNE